MGKLKAPRNKRNKRIKQGQYICKNPQKYAGDPTTIRYMSSLELSFMKYLDNYPNILKWGSETIIIPYFDKSSNKKRNYYVDIYVEYLGTDNEKHKALIEIKPSSQCKKPKIKTKTYNQRMKLWIQNQSKWQAAKNWAENREMRFFLLTEKDIR